MKTFIPLDDVAFQTALQTLKNAELLLFLNGPHEWNVSPDSLPKTRTTDWTVL